MTDQEILAKLQAALIDPTSDESIYTLALLMHYDRRVKLHPLFMRWAGGDGGKAHLTIPHERLDPIVARARADAAALKPNLATCVYNEQFQLDEALKKRQSELADLDRQLAAAREDVQRLYDARQLAARQYEELTNSFWSLKC